MLAPRGAPVDAEGAAAVVVRVTVTTVVTLFAELSPQPAATRPSRRDRNERGDPHGSRWTHSSESAPAASASSAASPDEREAQLAPLLRVPEPRGEILVDGVEARLALGREELAAGRLRDLPQRRRDRAARAARTRRG